MSAPPPRERRPRGPGRALRAGLLGGFLPATAVLLATALFFERGATPGHTPDLGPVLVLAYVGLPLYALCFLVGAWRGRRGGAGSLLVRGAAFGLGGLLAAGVGGAFFDDARPALRRWLEPEGALVLLTVVVAHALVALGSGLLLRLVPLGRRERPAVRGDLADPASGPAAPWGGVRVVASGAGLALLALGALGLALELWTTFLRVPLNGPGSLALAASVLLAVFLPALFTCRPRLAGRGSGALFGAVYWLLLGLAALGWYRAERGALPHPLALLLAALAILGLSGGCALLARPQGR